MLHADLDVDTGALSDAMCAGQRFVLPDVIVAPTDISTDVGYR
jgi:hypothetical protein